jgi:hypothetical protein
VPAHAIDEHVDGRVGRNVLADTCADQQREVVGFARAVIVVRAQPRSEVPTVIPVASLCGRRGAQHQGHHRKQFSAFHWNLLFVGNTRARFITDAA